MPERSDWLTINGVPLERRLQTAAVAAFVTALPLMPMSVMCHICSPLRSLTMLVRLAIVLLSRWPYQPLMILYLTYCCFFDASPQTGRRKSEWFRNLGFWKYFKDFFPISVKKTSELDPTKNYIFGYHPHGIIGFGAISCFATNAHDPKTLLPGLDLYLLTLPIQFRLPFIREVWLLMGICDSSKETFKRILSKGPGSSLAVVVGGAAEALKSSPGKIDLTLNARKGFVRQALLHSASLVPVIAFGETDVYGVLQNQFFKKVQVRLQKWFGFAMPLFHGRGIFNYNFGLIPHRRPITVVLGRAIEVPTNDSEGNPIAAKGMRMTLFLSCDRSKTGERWLVESDEGRAIVAKIHAQYVEELRQLYDENKEKFYSHCNATLSVT